MEYDDRPLPSQVLPEFDVDTNPVLTQFYRNKIQHYIGHPPPFTTEELMRASKIMFDVRHPEANPLLFRSIVGAAGITKKGYRKDFKDKKNHYLAFQRALVSLEPLPLQVAAPIAASPLQRVQSYPPASASFMPSYPSAMPSSPSFASDTPSSPSFASATPSRDLDERIRELQLKITQAPSIRKKIYQVQLAELIRQQQQQQQQLQQQQQQDNGGGKKYKKQSYKKRSTKKKRSYKKRSYKKRSKSIKRKAGGGRLSVFQQLAQGQGVSQDDDTDPDFWRRKGMIDRTSRERQRFQQETAWSGEDTDTE